MSLSKTIEVITKLAERGVIKRYAIAGAVAALNYIQPTLTEDLDILVSITDFESHKSGLILLTPIEKALKKMGYTERTDIGYLVEDWPVQFLPVSSPLEEEALEQAIEIEIGIADPTSTKARCLRAEHVVAIALNLGRLKDLARIEAFLEQKAVELKALKLVIKRHGLAEKWDDFCRKANIQDPLS
jgi:hypothetical protein